MAILRFHALKEALTREIKEVEFESKLISDYFGINVFGRSQMKKYLSEESYKHVIKSIDKGVRIDRKIADQVAAGMKAWALDRGATHYTHWFHPLTGGTAEKHDAFINKIDEDNVIEDFSGRILAQQEPDASSFPSGGLRNTFEARGYTAWDPSSPAFILGKTLSIPTIFVSYTGAALDYKSPLLRSLSAIDETATSIAQYFDKDVNKVFATLGWEQEYFLVDDALYFARPDLILSGRTLLGHSSAKDQQLDDHFFSSIPTRVANYMHELEIEAYKLGIPLKTKHNEVSPNQFEIVPVYEECNLAVDHNLLLLDLMKKISKKHHFQVILHEKPFKGINGSGKHNNWSLMTDTGVNLLSPGNKPKSNLQFLTFLVNAIKAVYLHQDLLRASIMSAGNNLRLGGHEAPPLIMSVFIGNEVFKMLDEIEMRVTNKKMTPLEKTELKLDVGKIPEILLDNTDSNRTSPLAFTGNRLEFRAVGASANCASPMTVFNTAVASQLKEFFKETEKLINKGVKKDEAIFQVLRKYIIDCKPIIFEGNSYSAEWVKEAERRGLSNITSVVEAYSAFISDNTIQLFKKNNVLTEEELKGRTGVMLDTFIKNIQIESRVLGDLAINHIVPTAVDYQTRLAQNVNALKNLFDEKEFSELAGARKELIKSISSHVTNIKLKVKEMTEKRRDINKIENQFEKAKQYEEKITLYLEDIRNHIDELETIVDDEIWPLPKYRELLFTR
ncbi:glutamine synthetase III [Bacteroidota bacterium]